MSGYQTRHRRGSSLHRSVALPPVIGLEEEVTPIVDTPVEVAEEVEETRHHVLEGEKCLVDPNQVI